MLQKCDKHQLAIKDFNQSLLHAKDNNQDYKIYNKIAQSQAKLGQFTDAIETLKLSLKSLNSSNICNETKKKFGQTIVLSIKKLNGKIDKPAVENSPTKVFSLDGVNPDMPGVSNKVFIVKMMF